ncbi:IclR family transcriptional regulator [Sphaerisporangium krabiense]|uniref:DNA-binding IclR family transcriptional regulator n=1 Tax=Sphaerisporangium krabiense TaxID=763782 RepID=A0A7W8Z8S5_9ACTN|nr:IclR family transcriptional regulator [Sphaerisporangium krabiense]MBB5629566.1 DNA-binding IclR family transcriptional regulator [Sphaerisporangium krabiense]GII67223.1 IclR family transcriptional regulator [Sphaerisporangium krabiense]
MQPKSRAVAEADAPPRENTGQAIATVERAVEVLVHFAETPAPTLGVTEIAEALGMSKAAVHRILASLRVGGLIELDLASRRYSLGVGAMRLGLAYLDRLDVRRIAGPELVALSQRTDETATLSIRTGWTRIYADQVTPAREVIMTVSLGVPYPLHAGGSSKAFLAFLPDDEIEAYLTRRPFQPFTGETVVDAPKLRDELTAIRERGWARSFGERVPGAASVAAPVFDHQRRPVAVIGLCGPQERFRDAVEACAEVLLESTVRLSGQMGGTDKEERRRPAGRPA